MTTSSTPPPASRTLSVAVLAAGEGRRLGRASKPLLRLGNETLLDRALRAARESGAVRILLVIGHEADRILREWTPPPSVQIVIHPDYARGQGSSLRAAARALYGTGSPDGLDLAVTLVDKPFLRGEHIRKTYHALKQSKGSFRTARAVHAPTGRPGHPVVFLQDAAAGLANLPDHDDAPRRYLRSLGPPLEVPFEEDDVLFDVDQIQDYLEACRRLGVPSADPSTW